MCRAFVAASITHLTSPRSLESINFYLLHLTLMREYLDLEFHDIEPVLPFEYSLEHVIDDFILLAVFVGNDFLPNLPDLHIHENGLEKLFDIYKKVLPSLGELRCLSGGCYGLLTTAYAYRWIHQRERDNQHETVASHLG